MKYACLFRENEDPILVSAEDIKKGIYSDEEEFIDPKYEFKVEYVKGARNNGGPYFRMYYSREDYIRIHPERAQWYDYVRNMRHYDETSWHKKWKQFFSDFCEIEKYIKDESTGIWKYADAYYHKTKTCIEFQHSYIARDFEARNEFYSNFLINMIWLCDLSKANVREDSQGNVEILENNAKGFFRISEVAENLSNYRVYIQVKSGKIYRVSKLYRKESSNGLKSTIRYFVPHEVYTEDEFVEAVRMNKIGTFQIESSHTLHELWKSNFLHMIVYNIEKKKYYYFNCNGSGGMYRDYKKHECIVYKFSDGNSVPSKDATEYPLKHEDENRAIWKLVYFELKK